MKKKQQTAATTNKQKKLFMGSSTMKVDAYRTHTNTHTPTNQIGFVTKGEKKIHLTYVDSYSFALFRGAVLFTRKKSSVDKRTESEIDRRNGQEK